MWSSACSGFAAARRSHPHFCILLAAGAGRALEMEGLCVKARYLCACSLYNITAFSYACVSLFLYPQKNRQALEIVKICLPVGGGKRSQYHSHN